MENLDHLNATQQQGVLDLISAATEQDGTPPIAEHILLHLRHGGDKDDRHLILKKDGEIMGYAHIDLTDPVAGSSAELVIHPRHRGKGLGRTLLESICEITSPRLWSHGDLPSAQKLAKDYGLVRVRSVIQMRRSLNHPLPELATDLNLRSFLLGLDDESWLVLNNRAFAGHPEQGGWTFENLQQRMNENWFDPRGFLLATRDTGSSEELIAFCWTKIHGAHSHSHDGEGEHGHDPIGEIYAMGVDPSHRGERIGGAITIAGLSHLRREGLMSAMLYVDAENSTAIKLYRDLGFSEWGRDVMYRESTH
ncbi:MAG: mycothiol synthase [Actinobacteria bacterium]|nr:mycothiol synthase [Actinomycetota bacterium]